MNSPSVAALSLIMLLAGFGIPVMAALNGGLGVRLGNPIQAAALLFAFAFCVSLVALVVQPNPIATNLQVIPIQFYLGGLFVAFYVLSVTFIAPKLGVGNAIVLVLLGQTLALCGNRSLWLVRCSANVADTNSRTWVFDRDQWNYARTPDA